MLTHSFWWHITTSQAQMQTVDEIFITCTHWLASDWYGLLIIVSCVVTSVKPVIGHWSFYCYQVSGLRSHVSVPFSVVSPGSLRGTKLPGTIRRIRSLDHSFHGPFVLWNFRRSTWINFSLSYELRWSIDTTQRCADSSNIFFLLSEKQIYWSLDFLLQFF